MTRSDLMRTERPIPRSGFCLNVTLGLSCALLPMARESMAQAQSSFLNINGVMWYFNTLDSIKFSAIQNDVPNMQNSGINILAIYCPYHGDRNMFRGCDPVDWYSVSPQCGTLQDFKNLTAAAHTRGMRVISYFANIYVDNNSDYFRTAESQYKAGNTTAAECATFRWSSTNTVTPKIPYYGDGAWVFSATAGAYYWSIWQGYGVSPATANPAAVDFGSPGGVATATSVTKFWIDAGLDGFMWDVGQMMTPEARSSVVTTPTTYTTSDKWLCAEQTMGAEGQNSYNYGYNCWANYMDEDGTNDYSNVVNGSTNADGLEKALQFSNWAHARNCWTYAWGVFAKPGSPDDPPTYANDAMRVQEAALLAGAGITYGCGAHDTYLSWSATLRANWGKVLKTASSNPALLPSATRTRLPITSSNNQKSFAMKRVSRDSSQTALLIYNFQNSLQSVTVNLAGSGIAATQTPVDLYNGGTYGSAITSPSYTVSLPAYGFAFLSVNKATTPIAHPADIVRTTANPVMTKALVYNLQGRLIGTSDGMSSALRGRARPTSAGIVVIGREYNAGVVKEALVPFVK